MTPGVSARHSKPTIIVNTCYFSAFNARSSHHLAIDACTYGQAGLELHVTNSSDAE